MIETNFTKYALTMSEAYRLPDLIQKGLIALCFCIYGTHRSPSFVKILNDSNIKSLYLKDGLSGLVSHSETDRKVFFDYAADVPNLVFLLDQFDQDNYQYVLAEINRKNGKIIINDNFSDIRKIYFSKVK